MGSIYHKTKVFGAACAGMLLFGVCFVTLGVVALPLKERFGMTDSGTGSLFATLPMGIIFGSMLFGPFADRYGYKWLMAGACGALFAGFIGIVYAPSLFVLKICVFCFGFGGGAVNGATNALVALISGEEKVSRLSLLGVFFGLGALGMPVVLGAVSGFMSYEYIVLVVSVITLAVAVIFLFILFPEPQQALPFSVDGVRQVFANRTAVMVAIFLFMQMGMEAIVNNWMTTFMSQYHGIGQQDALYGLSVMIGGMVVMRLLIGSVIRCLAGDRLLVLSLILMVVGALLLSFPAGLPVLFVALLLLGAGMAAGVPMMLGIIGGIFSGMAGTAFSVVIVIGLLGNLGFNYLVGYMVDQAGAGAFVHVLLLQVTAMAVLATCISLNMRKQSVQIK